MKMIRNIFFGLLLLSFFIWFYYSFFVENPDRMYLYYLFLIFWSLSGIIAWIDYFREVEEKNWNLFKAILTTGVVFLMIWTGV